MDVSNIKVYNLKGDLKQMEVKENVAYASVKYLVDFVPGSLDDPEKDKR